MRRTAVALPVLLLAVFTLTSCKSLQAVNPEKRAAEAAQTGAQEVCERFRTQSVSAKPGTEAFERLMTRVVEAASIERSELRALIEEKCPGQYEAAATAYAAATAKEAAARAVRKAAAAAAPAWTPPPGRAPATAAEPLESAGGDRDALAARLEQVANVLGYGPVQDRQGMAYVMQTDVCEPVAAGAKTWSDVIREDVENGAPSDAAARMASFLKTEFCIAY